MRRRVCALIALFSMVLVMSAQAMEPRTISASPDLSFSGTTAYCYVICRGASSSDTLDVTLTLYQGTTYVDSWSDSGQGRVAISGNCKVQSGKTYKLVVNFSVNGESRPLVYTTATCP